MTSACWKGHHEVVKLLLIYNSDIEHRFVDLEVKGSIKVKIPADKTTLKPLNFEVLLKVLSKSRLLK